MLLETRILMVIMVLIRSGPQTEVRLLFSQIQKARQNTAYIRMPAVN